MSNTVSNIIYVDKASTADYAIKAGFATYAATSSYLSPSSTVILSGLNLVGGGVTGSLGTNQTLNISSSQVVDTIPVNKGNSVKWIIFLENGQNSRANKVVASWNNATSSFYTTEIKSIGEVPVDLSVIHSVYGVSLVATPQTGSWGVKLIRILI